MSLQVPAEFKLSDDEGEDGVPSFSAVAYSGGKVPGYAAQLKQDFVIDLAGMESTRNVVANLDHKTEQRVGHVTDLVNDGKQIVMSGKLSAATPYRDEVAQSAKNGFGWEVSIEGGAGAIKKVPAKRKVTVNGQEFEGPIFVARKSKLTGVAFVSNGADEGNLVQVAASAQEQPSQFEEFALSLGADLGSVSDDQRSKLLDLFLDSLS